MVKRVFCCALSLAALGGCTQVGPDFKPVPTPWLDTEYPLLEQATHPAASPDLRQWWAVFADPMLDALIAEADAHNTDLRVAGLRIAEARAQLAIAQTGRYPRCSSCVARAFTSNRTSPVPPRPGTRCSGNPAWASTLPGKWTSGALQPRHRVGRRAVFCLPGQLRRCHGAVAGAGGRYLFQPAYRRGPPGHRPENAQRQARSLQITERLFRHGENDELDWQQARTQFLATQASIPELENQLNALRNVLCALLGRPPGPLPELASGHGQLPLPDRAILQDVPASLLQRRPDIRAAEQAVAAQSALVGVAEADLYPSLSLLGSIGWTFVSASHLPDSFQLAAGPSLIWNPFDYGRRKNAVRVEDARLQQLIELYQRDVREAAREADDAASGLVRSLQSAEVRQQASQAAQRSLELATSQYREGFADFQRVLDAQQLLLQQQDSYR